MTVDVVFAAGTWPNRRALGATARRAVAAAAAEVTERIAPQAEVAVVFADDGHIRALNRRFRGKDRPTDVLSFPAGTRRESGGWGPLLGDIVIARETLMRDAAEAGLPPDHHLIHLIVHGFLHLVGYDHIKSGEALAMEHLETTILGGLGIADPYRASPAGETGRKPTRHP